MEHHQHNAEEMLKSRGLRKTSARKEVLDLFLQEAKALSKQDIEAELGAMDRITLYRTLKSFEDKGLIHEALDGTNYTKYALCEEECTDEEHQHNHAHFHCEKCGITFCVDEVIIPKVNTPKGLEINSVEMVLKGLCRQCSHS